MDTGHDDAAAIMMAARNPALEIAAITVTAGNQTLPKTLANTLNICSALSIDAPVYAGMDRPLLAELVTAARIHGESGLDGPVFGPCTRTAAKGHAAVFIAEAIMSRPAGEVTLIAVGPLSNIAMAIRLEPAIVCRVREIVLMGGSIGAGNVTPSAEFNIHADPEAASIVFSSGMPIVMMGLDVTTKVVLSAERLSRFREIPGAASAIFRASMERYTEACLHYIGERPAMHDPCCVAWATDPSIFTTADCAVSVEYAGTFTRGRTVVDLVGVSGRKANARVALTVDEKRFWDLLEAELRRY